ncbi:MAG: hypothetical protein AAGF83_11315 [Cyanobacteria bacterium P01_G01_bin.67]
MIVINGSDGNDTLYGQAQFTIGAGAGAADASDRLIYNDLNGDLFFDIDGINAAKQVQIASLDSGLNLTTNNFIIF